MGAGTEAASQFTEAEVIHGIASYVAGMVLIGLVSGAAHKNLYKGSTFYELCASYPLLKWFWIGSEEGAYEKLPSADIETGPSGGNPDSGSSTVTAQQETPAEQPEAADKWDWALIGKFVFLVGGLQVCYLGWGLIQERIMSQTYGPDEESFTYSQFIVFSNRCVAFCIASIGVFIEGKRNTSAPFYMYCFAACGNVMGSWCQYEALRFISFPLQCIAKSFKIVITMAMGLVLLGKTYSLTDYVAGALVGAGLILFCLGGATATHHMHELYEFGPGVMLALGFSLMFTYVIADAFTSNWQSHIFTTHKVSPLQMMQGISVCAICVGFAMLVGHDELFPSIDFLTRNNDAIGHIVIMSFCSAIGQIFCLYNISEFGPVVFAIAMTCRQACTILFSMIFYGHWRDTRMIGWLGLAFVFMSLGVNVYNKAMKNRAKKAATRTQAQAA